MRYINPLLIRHRLFSVLLKDLISPELFDQIDQVHYYQHVTTANNYFTPMREQINEILVPHLFDPELNPLPKNREPNNDDFIIRRSTDLDPSP